ncbi:hypothetical protein BN6_79910 [Saccharothrix espanaensis DSM 44229]|uniref:Uncharacterized protein n=1 Tax=Saccharothrix espanaensis (strain ATCC 51144 / DSM 44229 / JCM 9112 / NBRC 15066 / NRRL 15764) TaxID=1179773 RepID=K0KEL6_SACES|nr:hypothetical protein BN6_79910 [Saccharothrix espanaensis DSM 44229]
MDLVVRTGSGCRCGSLGWVVLVDVVRLDVGVPLGRAVGDRASSGRYHRDRLTFTKAGEAKLSEWMDAHAQVAFVVEDEPGRLNTTSSPTRRCC